MIQSGPIFNKKPKKEIQLGSPFPFQRSSPPISQLKLWKIIFLGGGYRKIWIPVKYLV